MFNGYSLKRYPIMRSWAAFRSVRSLQRRFMATQAPTEGEVRSAYATLGVATSSTFEDIRRRYVELAKKHHPDVSGEEGTGASSRMVNINNAYATLRRLHQLGGCGMHQKNNCASGGVRASSEHSYYAPHDEPYQPWHEEINPTFYEMMWEEMHRQAENEAFEQASPSRDSSWRHHHHHQRTTEASRGQKKAKHGEKQQHAKGGQTRKKTTTWPDADVQAMVNMYQDGKSFDFIANALGKQTTDVVAEFNRWSEDNKSLPRARQRFYGFNYYAESPEVDFMGIDDDDDFTDNDPYGYGGPGDEFSGGFVSPDNIVFDGGAIPFRGGHYMNTNRQRRGNNNHNDKKGRSSRERGNAGGRHESRRRQR
ncbi:hypothetical protein, conserved [Trypanosoma brucei gambiense DAL972]|uniref:J domain-containing protein n=2 Tax=Trypanosoma brucei TaxID=5691 RepID=D0A9P8_TRYB9|nr:hypothetical protein, conserved [Trypanosoma brucei gambiense DAL972]CBH18399.1 hypothetical protein, conserved [Trypanosoma brucei gambiense DAL972]|eukprot:XP_011780663.1 hypothetical protein, conserved [Trypanosoma brucei gambiense DAL972]